MQHLSKCPCGATLIDPCAVWCKVIAAAFETVKQQQAIARDNNVPQSDRCDAIEWLFEYGWGIEACG